MNTTEKKKERLNRENFRDIETIDKIYDRIERRQKKIIQLESKGMNEKVYLNHIN